VPTFVSPASFKARAPAKRKSQIRSSDIPAQHSVDFQKLFLPRVFEYLGTQRPWHQISEEELNEIWEKAIPTQELDSELYSIIEKVVRNVILYILARFSLAYDLDQGLHSQLAKQVCGAKHQVPRGIL
jgi:hypothetical protein